MRYTLTDYQEVAVEETLRRIRRASRDFSEERDYTAISLTAPTGAGKTVIATSVIERLFVGDDSNPRDTEAVVLWITDDPSLNEQTRRKMLMASSDLKPATLVTVDESFDQESFTPGHVYFLNTQKLGTATSYVKSGTDGRRYSLWETIAASVRRFGGHMVVVIDEAHRGTGANGSRRTIVSRIISGVEGENPPVPVVWGISATPERFATAMAQAANPPRDLRNVSVPVEDVRASGLLKDLLNIQFPNDSQPSHATLTRHAATKLKSITERWERYSVSQNEPLVMPVMVVQIPAGDAQAIMSETMEILAETWPILTGKSIGHAFGEHVPLDVEGQLVRYISPEDIQDDPTLRVVFFKEALTTGWDCPRAEVMLSFRKAEDATYIAQLVGRMVRTPLARRIASDDVLNSVDMVLPYFDEEAVDLVIKRLTDDDGSPIIITPNGVVCERNPDVFQATATVLEALPTYILPGKAHTSQVRRLHALAARLEGDGLLDGAIQSADQVLIDTLNREKSRLEADGTLAREITGLAAIDVQLVSHSLMGDELDAQTEQLDATSRDVDSLFASSRRGLRDGLHKTYWAALTMHAFDEDQPEWIDPFDAKLITAALARQIDVVDAVESAAEQLVATWLKTYSRKIADLPDAARSSYDPIRAQARTSELGALILPEAITGPGGSDIPLFTKHVYTALGGYPFTPTSWEKHVLEAELGREDLIAWYRNPTGGSRALRVPYLTGDELKPMYPDFVFIHERDGVLKPSIVDPHNYAFADTGPKWRGLSKYADEHGEHFHRIDAVIETPSGEALRLDLKNASARQALADAATKEDILEAFKDHGGQYV